MADLVDGVALLKTLVGSVPDLKGRVDGAADLSELVRKGLMPNRAASAWVIPAGLRPRGPGEASAGAFTQMVDEHFAVVIALQTAGDATGAKRLPELNTLVWDIIGAVVGTDVAEAVGVFRLAGGRIVGLNAGLVTYQLEFALQIQLRNA